LKAQFWHSSPDELVIIQQLGAITEIKNLLLPRKTWKHPTSRLTPTNETNVALNLLWASS